MRRFSLLIPVLLFSGCSFFIPATAPNPDPNHTHADFSVWVSGRQLDFSGAQFMSGTSDDESTHPTEGPRKYLHLHDGNGHVVHRHKPELTFGNFLASIGFVLGSDSSGTLHCVQLPDGTKLCDGAAGAAALSWRFFVNGKPYAGSGGVMQTDVRLADAFVFADGDTLLLTYGADDTEVTRELTAMTDDACLYSKTCPRRGSAPTENCIADPEVPCRE